MALRCSGSLSGLEPIRVSAKGSSGGGEKIGPLSARHGIAEISDLYREYHDPVSLEDINREAQTNGSHRWVGEAFSRT
ncbi:MAG: hypothetical protein LBB62_00420 [Proteiniphilum sp.]|nr:hypothetical protein [Proteiniphilum sp.]